MTKFNPWKQATGTALVHADDVPANLQYIVRRDQRIVAAFAKQSHAEDYASNRSYNDESRFTLHNATAVLDMWQDGESARQRAENG